MTVTVEQIERTARAMYEEPLKARGVPFESWENLAPYFCKHLREQARIAAGVLLDDSEWGAVFAGVVS